MSVTTIAVTGATGFVGRSLCGAIEARGMCVRRLSTQAGPSLRTVKYVDVDALVRALEGVDVVCHVAGRVNGSTAELVDGNITSTEAMIAAAGVMGLKRFVLVSSAAAAMRKGIYGQLKKQAEDLLLDSGLPSVILRPTLIYGPGDTKNVAIMARTVRLSPVVPVLGGGAFKIQPVFINDVVSVLIQSFEKPLPESIYNVCGPEQISLREMLRQIAWAMRRRRLFVPIPLGPVRKALLAYQKMCPRTRLPVKQVAELDKHEAFDISMTRRDFDFDPIIFAEGIARTATAERW